MSSPEGNDPKETKEGLVATVLVEPSIKYKDSYLAAVREFQSEGLYLDQDLEQLEADFPAYVKELHARATEREENRGKVPETEFWLIDGENYIGRASVRHRLNEKLLDWGGHVAYDIRLSERKKGYGEKALQLVLEEAKKLGIDKVLLTCDSTNIGSRKVIESQGGVLENEVPREEGKPSKLRFWIDLK